jgi:hypothetical protein
VTFVFVSPRTWDNPKEKLEDWIKKKKALKDWADVKYIDGVGVEAWLDAHPAVAARYSRVELGRYPATNHWAKSPSHQRNQSATVPLQPARHLQLEQHDPHHGGRAAGEAHQVVDADRGRSEQFDDAAALVGAGLGCGR